MLIVELLKPKRIQSGACDEASADQGKEKRDGGSMELSMRVL